MDRTVLDTVRDALLKQPEILAKEFERQANEQRKLFDKSLSKTSLTDKKLIKILEEQSKAEGSYKEKIDKLLSDYIKEKNIQGEQLNELNSLMEKSNKIQEIQRSETLEQRKREQRENPLTAFKHAFEDLKKSNKEKGYFDVASSSKTLGKGLLEGFNLKTISKGLLHGAGVLFDNPAFNILADKISTSVKNQEIQNQRQFDFMKELEDIQDKDDKSNKTKAEESFQESYEQSNKELQDIKNELEKHTNIFKEQLFIQKDLANDTSSGNTKVSYAKASVAQKPEEDKEEGDFGLLGTIAEDMFNGKDKSRRKGKSASNALKGLGSLAMNIGRFAGPIAVVTGALFSVYEGMKGYEKAVETFDLDEGQIATTSQKLTSSISSIVDALTFGLFDEKAIAKKIDDMNSYVTTGIKKIFGQYDNSEKITDELEAKGVIDKSVIGDSQVRDWSAIEKLSLAQLQSLYDFGDWDKETESKLKDLIRQASSGKETLSVNRVDPYSSSTYKTPTAQTPTQIKMADLNKEASLAGVGNMSKSDKEAWYSSKGYDINTGKFTPIKSVDTNTSTSINNIPNVSNEKLPEPVVQNQVQQSPVIVQAPPATVINNSTQERKIDNLNLIDKDSATLASILGIGK